MVLHDFESDSGLGLSGFDTEQGAHRLGYLALFPDDSAFVIIGYAQFERDPFFIGFFVDIHCIRVIDDALGDVHN
jgi:hypothetical protein